MLSVFSVPIAIGTLCPCDLASSETKYRRKVHKPGPVLRSKGLRWSRRGITDTKVDTNR